MKRHNSETLIGAILIATIAITAIPFSATAQALPSVSFVVALDGSGNFDDIQAAIDAVPANTIGTIIIKAGLYELNPMYHYPFKTIAVKSNIILRGAGIDKTIIRSFPDKQPYAAEIRWPTILNKGDIQDVIVENMTLIQNGTPDNMGYNTVDFRWGTATNVVIRNVKVRDSTGAAISVPSYNYLTIENVDIETAYTGIAIGQGTYGTVKNSRVVNTSGDGIFPRATAKDLTIIGNYVEGAGDTGIDVTAPKEQSAHERILIKGNTLKNTHIRVSNAMHVLIEGNTFEGNSYVDADGGQVRPVNVTVKGNRFTSSSKAAIWFLGVQEGKAIGNMIQMTPTTVTQSGILAAIYGTGLIEGNTIIGGNYGISFADWWMGSDAQLTIRENTILDFATVGIWDDGKGQGPVLVENNVIWDRRAPFVSKYGIRTDYIKNRWTIRYNQVYAGSTAFISAPYSTLVGNIYAPPLSVIFSDGFESNGFDRWTAIDGSPTVTTTNPHHETHNAQFRVANGQHGDAWKNLPSTFTTAYALGYFKVDNLPTAGSATQFLWFIPSDWYPSLALAEIRNVGGVSYWNLRVYHNGAWHSYQSTVSPQANVYYAVELYLKIDSTAGAATVYVNGQSVISVTGIDTDDRGGIGGVAIGQGNTYRGSNTVTISADCIKVSNAYINVEAS